MRFYHKIAAIAVALCALSAGAAVIPSGIPAGYTGKPFCCDTLNGHYQQIPGVVKAVFFDSGGEGVGFHETTVGNQGGSMRLNKASQQIAADLPVDMQYFNSYWDWTVEGMTDSTGSQTWHISWIDPGEYQRMSCHVNIAGTYSICLHEVPATDTNVTSITFNEDTTTTIYVKNLHVPTAAQIHPGSEVWHAWDTFPNVGQVTLDTGLYVIKYEYVQGGFNFDWLKFALTTPLATQEPAYGNAAAGSLGLQTVLSGDDLKLSYNRTGIGEARISLVNCAGKTVLSSIESGGGGAVGTQSRTINLRNMCRGVYFVQVEQNGRSEVKSLTITH